MGRLRVATTAAACFVLLSALPEVTLGQRFERGNFTNPTRIDNRWSPLVPGTQFTFVGRADRGRGRLRHRVVFTVTDLTKVINGVRNVVMWDRDFNAGRIAEAELAFHAQDDEGNVWNMGEYPEEYKRGRFTGAPDSWLAGVARARAGILIPGNPKVGAPSYFQGWAPAIEFSDKARVFRMGRRTCVPTGCYRNVMITDEWNPLAPEDGHQRKYYAPGVGNVRVGAAGGKERETLVLTQVRRLSPGALVHVRREALKLERRAYEVRKDLFAHTPPAERAPAQGDVRP
jgi:hypothetical protein